MRRDKSRMNLHSWTELHICLCCLLTVLWAFVPTSSQMSVNVSHGICCRREHICMRASCFDRRSVFTLLLFSVKSRRHFTVFYALFFLHRFLSHSVSFFLVTMPVVLNLSVLVLQSWILYYYNSVHYSNGYTSIALKWSITSVEMYSTLNCETVRQV